VSIRLETIPFRKTSLMKNRTPCYPQVSGKIPLWFARDLRGKRTPSSGSRVPVVAGTRASEPGRASFAASPPEIIDGGPVVCRLRPTTFKCRRLRLQLLLIRPVVSSLRLCVRTCGRTCVR